MWRGTGAALPAHRIVARLLPSHTAAAFVKRLARLSLLAPTPCVALLLALIHNILLRHPACAVLVHRPVEGAGHGTTAAAAIASDPYMYDEPDPNKSCAMASSLWEIMVRR